MTRDLITIAYVAPIANSVIWFGAQAYLTVDYVQQRAAVMEGR